MVGLFIFGFIIVVIITVWLSMKVDKKFKSNATQYRKQANGKPFCPNCGCTELSANNRGFSMVTGTIGSKDVYVTCIKCGHRWKAGQYNYLYKD